MAHRGPLSTIAAFAALTALGACGGDGSGAGQDSAEGADAVSTVDALGDVSEADSAAADTAVALDTTEVDTTEVDTAEADTTEADTSEADTTPVCAGPTTCDDDDPCTEDTVVSGSADTCDLVCDHRDISGDEDFPDDDFVDSNCDGIDGVVDDLVFVALDGSNDSDCGAMDNPCDTIDAAIWTAKSAGKDIALAVGIYDDPVRLRDGVSIYGGYDRAAGWARTNAAASLIRTTLSRWSSDNQPHHTFGIDASGIAQATVLDHIDVELPTAGSEPSRSFIGVRVLESPGLIMRNMHIVTGAALAGADGAPGAQGVEGSFGVAGAGRAGGLGTETVCGEGAPNAPGGARGGDGGIDNVKGAIGTGSNSGPQAGAGVPGCGLPGGSAGSNWNNIPFTDTPGTAGGTGPSCEAWAARGTGATGNVVAGDFGAFSPWHPGRGNTGSLGANGFPGAGGGGGGSGDADTVPGGGDGGGGGSGSGGGCGGWGGAGGQDGGASVAVLAIGSQGFIMEGCTLTAGSGGFGGAGGPGGQGGDAGVQPGEGAGGAGSGGIAAHGGLPGGRGGWGTAGGLGGGGGGGQGGPSVALVLCDSSLSQDVDNTLNAAEPAAGGLGGYPAGADGSAGISASVLEGCAVPRPAVQIGWVRNDAATLFDLPSTTSTPTEGVAWDTCSPGYTLVAHDFQSNGWWLCARDGYEDARYIVGNGNTGAYGVMGVQRGNATDFGALPLDTCPGGATHLGDVGVGTDLAWVCVAPHTPTATQWAFHDDAEGWSFRGITATPRAVAGLDLTVDAGDPGITSPSGTYIDASYTKIRVRMSATAGSVTQMFFMRAGEGPSEARSVSLPLDTSGTLQDYVFDMSQNADWTGTITSLRFDVTDASSGTLSLINIRVTD